jgi:predicted glycoside hydrolase/deacetylase ChbG (UPF0249 family)
MRHLIINADGYGFTAGITRAVEECVAFGTVRSLSANVNFSPAEGLAKLVKTFPELSVGCHINPVVGPPVLPTHRIPSLIGDNGEFWYQDFPRRFLSGHIRRVELRAEMAAQAQKTLDLAGSCLSHFDFHMGFHRLPGLYDDFLEVAASTGARRIRTHRYLVGLENGYPRLRHTLHLMQRPSRVPKCLWNEWLRMKSRQAGFSMPDRRVEITHMVTRPARIDIANYLRMLENLPPGFNEFVAHPGYVDAELQRWSTYLEPRTRERQLLLSPEFRDALLGSDIALAGYRDIPLFSAARRAHSVPAAQRAPTRKL